MDDDPHYDLSVSVPGRNEAASATRPARSHDRAIGSRGGWAPITRAIRGALAELLRRHAVPSARIHVAISGDADIARLNAGFLGHDGPTDVLSFDLTERRGSHGRVSRGGDGAPPASVGVLEGDIIVSADTAAREAEARGHDLAAELALYAVHGALHLLGYDDADPADAQRMHDMEDEVLSAVGIGPVYGRVHGAEEAARVRGRNELSP